MNDQMQDLARRAVACKHWRWMPGMLALPDLAKQGGRVCRVDHQIELALDEREIDEDGGEWHTQMRSSINTLTVDGRDRWNHLPDLTDPATLGCLLALVIERYPSGILVGTSPWAGPSRRWHESQQISCCINFDDGTARFSRYGSIAEALVAALEAAP